MEMEKQNKHTQRKKNKNKKRLILNAKKKEVIADSNNQTDKAMDYPMDLTMDIPFHRILCIYLIFPLLTKTS